MKRTAPLLQIALAFSVLAVSACLPDASRRDRVDAEYLRLLDLEDARPTDGPALASLIQATATDNVFLRRTAFRALGRLENPDLLPRITPGLTDASPSVRAVAANAVAQAHQTSEGASGMEVLEDALSVEQDATVRGAILRSLGRLSRTPAERERATTVIVDATTQAGEDAPLPTLIGAVLGLESIARRQSGASLGAAAEARLRELSQYGYARPLELGPGRVRTLATAALGASGAMDQPLIVRTMRDDHPQVSATAFRFIGSVPDVHHPDLVRRSVVATSVQTIIEGFRFIQSQPRTTTFCQYLMAGAPVLPPEAPVQLPLSIRIAAIDGLAEPCPDVDTQIEMLREIASDLPDAGRGWQPAVHALMSLTQVSPANASALLGRHAAHGSGFVRAWAARSAAVLGNRVVLETLIGDADPNVRTAALRGLFELDGHRMDETAIDQLSATDPQLVMTAARLLAGTDRTTESASVAIDAFDRISAARRETWRDPRMALLGLLGEVGNADLVPRLEPYLSDYDPEVAEAAAELVGAWTGRTVVAAPNPPSRLPVPTVAELQAMDGATVVLHMRDLGEIHIALLPYEATTNTYRFFRLAREGYFDGLTFHRWARNFVIQGGSPNANEYEGDGPFTRDEVGLVGHWRGFVGISTRGHDTGDGQIFVNLIDNVRLDHAYTVIGAVTRGMDVVDEVLEGSVIERAEVRSAG
ncbi:MAG: peptidylprolyl isomerase [Gemmatimonadota bacterium]